MNFEQFRQATSPEVFDYQLLTNCLKGLKKPRDKVTALIADGKIVRLKKGLYVFGEAWRRSPLSLEMIANLIYGPSCISFEYALTHYGFISERATVITSLTIGDTKTFHTPIGTFEYRAIGREKFKVGIDYKDLGKSGGYFIASKEKAVVDLVYRTSGIRTLEQLRHYLFEEMRIDETMFRSLDFHKLSNLLKAYDKNSVNMMSQL
jgi:predicted transcriptional regulator of viral defense system